MSPLRSILGILLLFGAGVSIQAGPKSARSVESIAQRAFSFTYEVRVPANALSGSNPHLWIPLPQSDAHQSISALRIASRVRFRKGRDPFYDNAFAMFAPTPKQALDGFRVLLRFHAIRREYQVNLNDRALQNAPLVLPRQDRLIQRYLDPDTLVPLNATIAELAKEKTAGATTPLEKARRIFEYVAGTMRYDKSGQGWGRGDEMWACISKRGNCTDFHSVVIGMLRSSKIPARFEIGFPLPDGENRGIIAGYHCWVEFYLNGAWIPLDASEASQNPAKRVYYFGAVDANRVRFTYGRDIQLSSLQKGEPLNYFIYPYVEAGGKPVKGVETRFSFRDLPAQSAASLEH